MERIALQLYSIRDDLVRDVDAALDRVRSLGFQWVEAMHWPDIVPVHAIEKACRGSGIRVCSLHGPIPAASCIEELADAAGILGTDELVWHGWPRDQRHDSLAGVDALATAYREASDLCLRHGLRFSLHNHWWEFEPIADAPDAVRPFDHFRSLLEPEVDFELDTYWTCVGGADPVAMIRALARTPRHVHLKDGPGDIAAPKLPLGAGILPLQAILDVLPASTWKIIEMDDCAGDIWAALETSLHRLTAA